MDDNYFKTVKNSVTTNCLRKCSVGKICTGIRITLSFLSVQVK